MSNTDLLRTLKMKSANDIPFRAGKFIEILDAFSDPDENCMGETLWFSLMPLLCNCSIGARAIVTASHTSHLRGRRAKTPGDLKIVIPIFLKLNWILKLFRFFFIFIYTSLPLFKVTLQEIYLNTTVVLRVLLTTFVAVASHETSFNNFKITGKCSVFYNVKWDFLN